MSHAAKDRKAVTAASFGNNCLCYLIVGRPLEVFSGL